jgi:hypothetical protein
MVMRMGLPPSGKLAEKRDSERLKSRMGNQKEKPRMRRAGNANDDCSVVVVKKANTGAGRDPVALGLPRFVRDTQGRPSFNDRGRAAIMPFSPDSASGCESRRCGFEQVVSKVQDLLGTVIIECVLLITSRTHAMSMNEQRFRHKVYPARHFCVTK